MNSFQDVERMFQSDDGLAAQQHLDAGQPIYYGDPSYPDAFIREYPDGRLELVSVTDLGEITPVRFL